MKEFGGYLPLELKNGKEYYEFNDSNMKRYNSGRTAIVSAVKNILPNRIFLPYYICETVDRAIKKFFPNTKILKYKIDKSLYPNELDLNENDCVLIVNYFGLMDQNIQKFIESYNNMNIIVDNTQAFFSNPVWKDKVYNVYSCRKFIGVPDGGYLISKEKLNNFFDDNTYSSEYSGHILKSIEYGTNYSYLESKKNEDIITNTFGKMSLFTNKILKNADYEFIKEKRISNFNYLNEILRDYNLFEFESFNDLKCIPYGYPFLTNKDIHQSLVNDKIYIPFLWKEILNRKDLYVESSLSSNMVLLPIDQRYDKNDMMYLAETVKSLVGKKVGKI